MNPTESIEMSTEDEPAQPQAHPAQLQGFDILCCNFNRCLESKWAN